MPMKRRRLGPLEGSRTPFKYLDKTRLAGQKETELLFKMGAQMGRDGELGLKGNNLNT